ncbi:MAG: radical SAM protein [Bacteroidetes bacterium]|nr:MAG: radical SAM protein [Bacteroidota bacterium]
MEHFYTVQGEGAHSGVAAYFIRLGGCDVGCVWCDVKESWDASAHPSFSISDIVSWPVNAGAKTVVITGGEPLMYDLGPLTFELKNAGLHVHIETSGAHPYTGHFDWVTFSPKKFKAPLLEVAQQAHELKVVVFNKSDFAWAESFVSQVNEHCQLYLQPEWDKQELVLPLIIDYVKQHPQWRISLQTHKYMNIP